VGSTQSARATKYIEFHGSVRLPHVYLPAHSLHITERALQRPAASCRKQVRLTGRKLRQLVQIQIEGISQSL
jgi:hypothetical protein